MQETTFHIGFFHPKTVVYVEILRKEWQGGNSSLEKHTESKVWKKSVQKNIRASKCCWLLTRID